MPKDFSVRFIIDITEDNKKSRSVMFFTTQEYWNFITTQPKKNRKKLENLKKTLSNLWRRVFG